MTDNFHPHPYSTVDSWGNRTILLAIDIMVEHGERFYCTFRWKAPLEFSFSRGWHVDGEGLEEALYKTYPTLRNRKDVLICLADAKPIRPSLTVPSHRNINNHHYEKVRHFTRAGRTY